MRKSRGFSLVELMVVVAIIGTLVAVAGYAFSGSNRALNVGAFCRAVHFLELRARAEATADGRQRRIQCAPAASGSGYLCTYLVAQTTGMRAPPGWNNAGDLIQSGPSAVLWALVAGAQVSAFAPGVGPIAAPQSVTFFPDGTATAATLFFTDVNQKIFYKTYVYGATGMARMVDQW